VLQRITTDMLITELYNAQAAVMAAPNYASLAPRNVTVTLTAYELRSLHILLFGMVRRPRVALPCALSRRGSHPSSLSACHAL
jgi:hypothetical protein